MHNDQQKPNIDEVQSSEVHSLFVESH